MTGAKMEATTRRSGWPRLYFDSIEHLLNYPDWIERLKADGTKKPIRMVMNRLETLEAPLHHTVEMFFTLAPHDLIAQFLDIDPAEAPHLRIVPWQDLERVATARGGAAALCELCQPDILVEGRDVQVAVEIKAKSKSSLEQVLKYAALTSLRPRSTATRKLVFLAPYETFAHFWTGKAHADVSSLKDAARQYDDPNLNRKFRRFGTSLDEVKAHLDDFQIAWKSVRDLRLEVGKELQRISAEGSSASGEVYRKLLSGFELELLRWQADK
jgi:hypothetical protein